MHENAYKYILHMRKHKRFFDLVKLAQLNCLQEIARRESESKKNKQQLDSQKISKKNRAKEESSKGSSSTRNNANATSSASTSTSTSASGRSALLPPLPDDLSEEFSVQYEILTTHVRRVESTNLDETKKKDCLRKIQEFVDRCSFTPRRATPKVTISAELCTNFKDAIVKCSKLKCPDELPEIVNLLRKLQTSVIREWRLVMSRHCMPRADGLPSVVSPSPNALLTEPPRNDRSFESSRIADEELVAELRKVATMALEDAPNGSRAGAERVMQTSYVARMSTEIKKTKVALAQKANLTHIGRIFINHSE